VLHAVGWALVHSLWQCTALALALAAALRAMRRAPATHRYTLSCATLALMLATTAGTAVVLARSPSPAASRSAEAVPAPGSGEAAPAGARPGPAAPAAPELSPRWVPLRAGRIAPAGLRAAVEPLLPALVAAWLAGVALLSLRLAGGWRRARRLVREGTEAAPEPVRRLVARLARELGLSRPVEVLMSGAVHVPSVVGWLRPVILLPLSALTGIEPRHLELLILHELAHIRRYDYLVNLVQSAAETLLFHHPAVWWVGGRIRAEREHCCDDVAARLGSVRDYIAALARMEEVRRSRLPLVLAADGGSLLARALRLAEQRSPRAASPARLAGAGAALLATAALAFALLGGRRGPPSAPPPAPAVSAVPAPGRPPVERAAQAVPCPGAPPEPGSTRCPDLERAVAELLAGRGAPEGSVAVVEDVGTGAVLAYLASGPDGNTAALTEAAVPGSVWKLVVASLWWESGQGDAPVPCPAELAVGARTVRNSVRALPRVLSGPQEMLVHSCNTAAVEMALRLRDAVGAARVEAGLRRLGFGGDGGAGRDTAFWATRSEAFRARMSPELARAAVGAGEADLDWADFALGMRRVSVSPLHVARFVQAIGNGGTMLPPTLDAALAGRSPGHRALSPETAERLQHAMLDVVRRGTARGADSVLAGSPWRLGGKTGTVPGAHPKGDGWFAGLAFDAAGRARYAVVVRIPGGGPGGREPARVAAQIVRMLPGPAASS
jgi:beta-lactamase regulating signal transducer with metallopeptidase domain